MTDYVDLGAILRNVLDKKKVILSIALGIFIFTMLYVASKPKQYQAALLLQISQNQRSNLAQLSDQPRMTNEDRQDGQSIALQIALIRSRFILLPVIHSLGLDIKISKPLLDRSTSTIHFSELQIPSIYLNKTLSLIVDNDNQYQLFDHHQLMLSGKTGEAVSTEGFKIKVDSFDAKEGSQFLITKKSEIDAFNHLLASLAIIDLSNSLENNNHKMGLIQLTLIGENPELIARILNEIAAVTKQKSLTTKILQTEKKLAFLKKQLLIVKNSLHEYEILLNNYKSTTGKPDMELQSRDLSSQLSDIDKQLEVLRSKKSSLLQQYTPLYPFVIAITEKMDSLIKQRDEMYLALKKLPSADQSAADIYRDINAKNKLYMGILNQIHELEMAKSGFISDVHVLVPATPPDLPIPVRLVVIGAASFIIGIILGCLLVISWKIISRHVDDPNWVEKILDLKNLVEIPPQRQADDASMVEALCYLRTWLQLHCNQSQNTVSFIGLNEEAGTPFIIANLAVLLAKTSEKVLLIDANLHVDNQINQYFSLAKQPGLSDILLGKATLQTALVQPRQAPQLYILTAGTRVQQPTDLLATPAFQTLLQQLSNEFQFILINAATCQFPSSCVLTGIKAQQNLLVIGAGVQRATAIMARVKQLRQAGLVLHGAILNHAKKRGKTIPGQAQKFMDRNSAGIQSIHVGEVTD